MTKLRLSLAIFAALLPLSDPLAAQDRAWRPASDVLVPPPEYDPRVKGWPRGVRIVEVPFYRMQALCAAVGPLVQACYKPAIRTIVIPSGMPADLRRATLRHEGGHAWGWVHPKRGQG